MATARIRRLLREWLWPFRHAEAAAGWVALVPAVLKLFLPAAIVSAIAGTVVAFLTSNGAGLAVFVVSLLLALALVALWRHIPVSSLSFGETSTDGPLNLFDDDGTHVGSAKYFHVEILSPKSVYPVHARAMSLEQKNALGEFEAVTTLKPPHDLRWDTSAEDYMTGSVEPDLPGRVNLVNTESTHAGITMLCVRIHRPGIGTTHLLSGEYRLTVRVSAAGLESKDAQFLIHADQDWDKLEVKKAP